MTELRVFGNVHFKSCKIGLVNLILIFLLSLLTHTVSCQLPHKEDEGACPQKRLVSH